MVPSSICWRISRPSARGLLMNSGDESDSCATKVADRASGAARSIEAVPSGLIGPVVSITSENVGTTDASKTVVENSAECTTMSSPGRKAAMRDAGIATA